MNAVVEIPDGGATGPIAAMGGDSWSLYLNDQGVPTFWYNSAAAPPSARSGIETAHVTLDVASLALGLAARRRRVDAATRDGRASTPASYERT